MYEEMNLGKGFLVPPQKEALAGGFWMEMPSQGRPQDLPNDCLEAMRGSSNWQEFLGDGAAYPQPLEVQNHNTVYHDFNGTVQASLLPGIGSTSSGNRNGGLNSIDEAYAQPLNVDDGSWSGSWEQLLSLMNAPSAAPENVMANKGMRATNDHVLVPNSGSQSGLPLMNAPYVVQRSGTASSSVSVAAGRLLPSSCPQGSNLMQSMMKAPPMSNWNGIQHKSINAYSQESSYQMQHDFTSSTPLDQGHYASIHRHGNSLPYTIPDGFPVCYDPRYNLNNTHVDASSSITSSSQFAPMTPQQVKRSHLYAAEMNLSLDESLNRYKAIQDDLMASSITQSSHFAPATPQPAKAADNYQYPATQSLSLDQIQKQDIVQQDILPGSIENESTSRDCQELLHSILDSSSTAIGTSFKEKNGSETEAIQNIDLNKTPSLKAPRRKKHRPKVIRENKPPRNRKPAKEKVGPDGTPVPKRKYVRKDKSNGIKTPQQDVGEKTKDFATEPTSKSCRKSLHFELENGISDTIRQVDQRQAMFETHPVTRDGLTDKSYMSTSQEDIGATVLREKSANGYQIPGYHPLYAGVGQTLQEITAQEELERTRQTIEQIQKRRVSQYIQSRGSKRDYVLASSGISTNTTNSQLCQEIFQNEHMRTNNGLDQCYSGTQKRKRNENLSHTTNSSIQCSTRFADDRSRQVQLNRYPVNRFLEVNGGLINSYHSSKTSGNVNPDPASGCISLLREPISAEASLRQEMLADKEAKISALAHVINSVGALTYPNMQNQMSLHVNSKTQSLVTWKGSVVDSVIGVFLTQNVTDHLSSSAFMSLASQFPPQSIRRDIESGINKPDAWVEESQICIVETNDKMQGNDEIEKQVNYNRIPNEPLEYIQKPVKASAQSLDELVSSQDSAESSIVHMNGTVQSLYMSGLTADCPTNGCQSISRYSTMSFIIQEMENHARFPNFRSQDSGSLYYKTATDGHLQLQNEEASEQKNLDGTYSFDLNSPQFPSPISSSSCQLPAAGGLVLSDTDGCNTLRSQHYMSLQSTAVSKDMGVTSIGTEQEHEKTWPTELLTENSYILQRKHKIDQINTVQNYHHQSSCCDNQRDRTMNTQLGRQSEKGPLHQQNNMIEDATANTHPRDASSAQNSISAAEEPTMTKSNVSKVKGTKAEGVKKTTVDWDCLRRQVKSHGEQRERSQNTMDSIDYEALQHAHVSKISEIIRERGMNNMLAERIKDFLDRLLRDHGSMDLEWLRDAPPDKAKDYLLSIRGLGLKSVECIRLLTLHQHAFPVDTNVGRIAVRLGWVPLQPLPESLQLHLLEMYPILESVQKYLYPRLCNLDQRTLYELHYQLITFGKVFCTKTKPNCNACPMRGECRHFASAFASSRLALPGPEEKSIVTSNSPIETSRNPTIGVSPLSLPSLQEAKPEETTLVKRTCEPIVEEPTTPEPESTEISEIVDIEEAFYEDSDEIPTIRLNVEEFTQNLQIFMQEGDMSKALVAFDPQVASIPTPKLKNVSRLRTEHQVYQLPDSHPLLKELDKREPDDPSPYLLAIWTPGETANSIQPPQGICNFRESGYLCAENTCFTCNSVRESNAQTVRGTLLIPCRTAMRGSFPLNGTYFQVNEVFADHESSLNPIDVPREWIWNLPRSTVYFGTSVSAIFRGMSTEEIQHCFWRGFVCVRGFDQKTRIPRPLMARLHFSASKQMREADKRSKKLQNN